MQLFVCACELRSLNRAAERLNLAPSAVTRRIQLLEHDAKMPLLERLPHGVQPTASGKTFLRFARDILHLVDRADHLLVEHETAVRGYVRVSSSSIGIGFAWFAAGALRRCRHLVVRKIAKSLLIRT